jgi:hypothetical protein
MRPMISIEAAWLRLLWPGLLVAVGAALTTVFACIAPFAAFAVIGAISLSRWKAACLTAVLWLATQAVGYGVLRYPWNARSLAWGVTIGAGAVIGTLAAHWTLGRARSFRTLVQALLAFVAAFGVYQLTLYAVAVSVLGGTGAFVPRIVGQVLLVNAVTLVGLYGLNELVAIVGSAISRRRSDAFPARFA